MGNKVPGVLSLVLVPAVITLVVSVLRLVGEINGWNEMLFGKPEAGGGGALLGISWLIFVFGLWFGIRVRRAGGGPASPGIAFGLSLLAIAVGFGGFFLTMLLGLATMPDAEHPGEPTGLGWMMAAIGVGALLTFVANRRVAFALLVYSLLARIPVVIITWFALGRDWKTHYTALPPEFTKPADADLFGILALPQVTFWPAMTMLLGTAMGCLGAMFVRPRKG